VVEDEEDVADYYDLRKKLDELAADFKDVISHPSYSLPFLQPGRLVKIKHLQLDFGWGVVINYQKRTPPKVRSPSTQYLDLKKLTTFIQGKPVPDTDGPPQAQFIVDVLLNCAPGSALPRDGAPRDHQPTATPGGVQPCPPGQKGVPLVLPVLLSTVDGISHLRIFLPKDLRACLQGRLRGRACWNARSAFRRGLRCWIR